jgi:hypothetical protein
MSGSKQQLQQQEREQTQWQQTLGYEEHHKQHECEQQAQ